MNTLKRSIGAVAVLAAGLVYAQCSMPGGCTAPKQTSAKPSKPAEINTEALAVLIRTGQSLVLLDARSSKYDDGRRIPGARSLTDKSTAEEADKTIGGKDKLVVTYCASTTCPASRRLAKHLEELGYTNVIEYPEGIAGWVEAGHSVTGGSPPQS